jgi:hypothetical protein
MRLPAAPNVVEPDGVGGARGHVGLAADQPTVPGQNPLAEMFWNPGIWRLPTCNSLVLALSWLVTTLFCHLLVFTTVGSQRGARRSGSAVRGRARATGQSWLPASYERYARASAAAMRTTEQRGPGMP